MRFRLLLPFLSLACTGSLFADSRSETSTGDDQYRLFGRLEETSRLFAVDYYGPRDAFDERFRDIDVVTLSAMHSWRLTSGFEAQLGGGVLIADGSRLEPLSSEPARDSDALGVTGGGALRYNFTAVFGTRPFVDLSVQFLWAERPFPAGGSAINGFGRWGAGLEMPLAGGNAIELGYRWAHVSNGGDTSGANPAWDGEGFFIAWRRRLE